MTRQQFIHLRAAEAARHYQRCELCEHRCKVNRLTGQRGKCNAGPAARVFRHAVEYGEEADLVPSHVFYLSGCDLRCVFCIAGLDAFDPGRGEVLDAQWFREQVQWGKSQGAANIQWSGGEPSLFIPSILQAMAACPDLPPVVWKSNFNETPEAMDLLAGVVDVYLADLKFGNNACAARLAGIQHYFPTVTRNLQTASTRGRLIVRHLLLPGHETCCYQPILQWLSTNLPDIELSIRGGYLPFWRAQHFPDINRPLPRGAERSAIQLARQTGLKVIP